MVDIAGARDELTLSELRRMDCVDDNNVHLKRRANQLAADILCNMLENIKKVEKRRNERVKRCKMD
jgi:hypothetical protein